MTRICYQEKVNAGAPQACTVEKFNELLDSPVVKKICEQIANLDAGTPDYNDKKQALKKRLPILIPHACAFVNENENANANWSGKRKSELAVPSGLAMLDVDHVADPHAWFSAVDKQVLSDHHIYLVSVTASGQGLRIIGERLLVEGSNEMETIEQAQLRMATALGINEFDSVTKDLARASYVVPRDFILWIYEAWLLEWPSEELREWWTKPVMTAAAGDAALKNDAQETNLGAGSTEHETMTEELCYMEIPYKDIVNALLVVTGNAGGAIQGERNTVYFTLCNNMRYICDFKADVLLQVLPDFGLSVEERRQTIHSSLGRPRRDQMPVTMQSAISMARSLANANADENANENGSAGRAADLVLPELPPLLKTMCSRLPETYHAALVMSSLPLLGTLATKMRFTYLDGQEQSPSFFTVCVAPAASGKSFIRKPFELLKTPLLEHDELAEQAEREFLKKKAAAKNSKNQPEDPEVFYRIQPINISIAKYLQQQSRAGDLHLYSEAEEMDTLVKSESRGAWSQKSDLYRVGFDNQKYGQSYMNTEFTCSATVNVFYNLYVSGTPKSMERFFKDIENGLATRVSVVQLPDTTYSDMPHFGSYSAKEKEEIVRWARKLHAAEGEFRSTEVDKAIGKWLEAKRQQAIDSDSRAADVFRRRSAVIGWRAGMLSTLLYEGKRGGQMAAAFAEYAAEYTFRAQMNMWGDRMEQEIAAGDDITGGRGEATALLSRLPEEFTTQMLIALRSKAGQSVKPNAINTLLSRWKKLGRITKVGEGMFRRLH